MSQGMFSQGTACENCGAVDFDIQSGYFICRNCDTQSQDIQQQSFDDFIDGAHVAHGHDEKEEIVSQKIDEERRLTSWECYNIILKGLVDELIELGADKRLQKTVFQLWALYLHKEQIAFFSDVDDQLPILPSSYKNQDIEILYGIRNFRRMYLKDLMKMHSNNRIELYGSEKLETEAAPESAESDDSGQTNVSRRSVRSLRRKQRKLAMSFLENETSRHETDDEFVVVLPEDLKRAEVERRKNQKKEVPIAFKKSTVEQMHKLMKQFERTKQKYGNDLRKIPRNIRTIFNDRIYGKSNRVFPKNMSTAHDIRLQLGVNLILALLRLALFLIEDNIQWADLFRWTCEGRLSCFRVSRFLPRNASVRHTDLVPATRNYLITNEIRRLATYLNIREISTPDLFLLIERYTFELCLPREFLEFTKRVMAIFLPQMDYSHYDNRAFPDYECRAMGFILFVVKLLFSLDDTTEMKQSEFADAVNRNLSAEVRLFSWTEWIRYMECRKAVLCKYDMTMNFLYESQTGTTDEAFLKFWWNTEPDIGEVIPCQRLDKNLVNELEMAAKRFQNQHVDEDATGKTVNFPASMTPFRTYTQHLIDDHRHLLSDRSYRILSTDFHSYSIRYLLDPDWATDVGLESNLTMETVFGAAVKMEKYEEPKPNVPRLHSKTKVIPAHIPTPVRVIDDCTEPKPIEEAKSIQEFHPEFKCSDESSNEDRSDSLHIKLHHPATNYWFLHHLIGRTTDEKFKEHARRHLSVSFLYLLRECSRVLRCDLRALYEELANIEMVYACLFGNDPDYCAEAPFVLLPPEW